jgi:hypothetical protein
MALGPNSGYAATDLRGSAHWRLAVWGLRLAGLGLFVAIGGLVTRGWSTGTGLTILAIGVVISSLASWSSSPDSSRLSGRFQSPDPRTGGSGDFS